MNDPEVRKTHEDGQPCEGCGECDHAGAPAAADPHAFMHDEAPQRTGFFMPDRGTLIRGLGLAAISVVSFGCAVYTLNRWGQMASPIGGLFGTIGALSMWATLIHFTGGEKFDDHPWV